jgi:methyl-accepting chemotaxis protein
MSFGLRSVRHKVALLVAVSVLVVAAIIMVLALRGIESAVNETSKRQAAAARTATYALGNRATGEGEALAARVMSALVQGDPALRAFEHVVELGDGAAAMAVDRDGRILTGPRAGTKSGLVSQLPDEGVVSGFAVVPAVDLQALGLAKSTRLKVVGTETGVAVDFDELRDALAIVATGRAADGGRLIAVKPLNAAHLVDETAKMMGSGAYSTIFQGDVRIATTVRKNGTRTVGTTVGQKVHDWVYGGNRAFTGEAIVVDRTVISHYEPIRNFQGDAVGMWYAGYLKSDVEATASATMRNMLIGGALVLLLAAGAAVVFAARLLKPLRELTPRMEAIAEGEIDEPPTIRRRDEFGDMATAFSCMVEYLRAVRSVAERVGAGDLTVDVKPKSQRDAVGLAFKDMIENLRRLVAQMSRSAATVSLASQEMSATSEEAGRAVGEIAVAVSDVAQGAERQVRMVETTREAAADAACAASDSASKAGETAEVAEQTLQIARDGVVAAQQATDAIRALSESSRAVTETIGELSNRSNRIGSIVDAITGIAEQTNLLALNAAIEAARAGEHGRGFAVVAEEVRKLAEESRHAAAEISKLISEMQTETGKAVDVVADGARRTTDGVATVAHTRDAFEQIGAGVESMSERVSAIADAAAQIAVGAEHIRNDISEVATLAESSSASAEQVSASTQQTSATTEQIAASAGDLATTAEQLRLAVGLFKLELNEPDATSIACVP